MNELIVTPLGTVSPYCKDNKNCPSFLIEYQSQRYLLDCGNGASRLMNFPDDLNNLKILISHLHPDHYGDISCICQAALVYKRLKKLSKNIEIYIPSNDIITYPVYEYDTYINLGRNLNTKTKHIADYSYIHSLEYEKNYPVNIIDYSEINIKNKDLKITSLKVPHQIYSYAFRIDTPAASLVYSGDTGTKNNLREFAKNADLLICESTFLRGQHRTEDAHLYAHEAAEIAASANVRELLLTHFWPEIDKEVYVAEAREIFKNTSAAIEGKKLVLRRKYE